MYEFASMRAELVVESAMGPTLVVEVVEAAESESESHPDGPELFIDASSRLYITGSVRWSVCPLFH